MKVEIGKRAGHQIERVEAWWKENRRAAPRLFQEEFEEALLALRSSPKLGVFFPTLQRPGLRRVLLPRTQYHLYFSLERGETVVVIHAVWSARRGHGPAL